MTYYELLLKVSFDEIAPFLSNSYTEGKPLAPFKMHYDYLRHLVPQQNEHNDKIIVYLIPPAADSPRITIAEFLDKNPLEESLDMEVVVEDNADIPLAEIAACCIYVILVSLPSQLICHEALAYGSNVMVTCRLLHCIIGRDDGKAHLQQLLRHGFVKVI
jgi:hypothetical protein